VNGKIDIDTKYQRQWNFMSSTMQIQHNYIKHRMINYRKSRCLHLRWLYNSLDR